MAGTRDDHLFAAEQDVTTSEVLRRWVDDGITAHDHAAELGSVAASGGHDPAQQRQSDEKCGPNQEGTEPHGAEIPRT